MRDGLTRLAGEQGVVEWECRLVATGFRHGIPAPDLDNTDCKLSRLTVAILAEVPRSA